MIKLQLSVDKKLVIGFQKSNPFLRKFFDHIAGTEFDDRLAKIVDELCEVFCQQR